MRAVLESYITHIRIVEDASYPSSPPPPESSVESKKPRLIIVAVRKTGRVRIHKARENVNGSFSIGKSWILDELSAIESFNGAQPSSPEEEQRKEWAGAAGFIVTLGKPYYWQAGTQKEKQFFIGSLTKIYIKYTGGKLPVMIGFDQKEMEQLPRVGAPQGRPSMSSNEGSMPPQGMPPQGAAPSARGPREPPRRAPSREQMLRNQPSRDVFPQRQQAPPRNTPPPGREPIQRQPPPPQNLPPPPPLQAASPLRPRREQSPSASTLTDMGAQQSQPSLRRLASAQGQEPSRRDGETPSPRSRSGTANAGLPGQLQDRGPPSRKNTGDSALQERGQASRPNTGNAYGGPGTLPDRTIMGPRKNTAEGAFQERLPPLRKNTADSPFQERGPTLRKDTEEGAVQERAQPTRTNTADSYGPSRGEPPAFSTSSPAPPLTPATAPLNLPPPERRRPPMLGGPSRTGKPGFDEDVPAPLSSPAMRANMRPPTRGSDESMQRDLIPDSSITTSEPESVAAEIEETTPKKVIDSPSGMKDSSDDVSAAAPDAVSPTPSAAPTAVSPLAPPPEPKETERPGLGPMIKKKSKGDIANTFLRVANAAQAFKPRAGGAAERLRDLDKQPSTTGYVPAPSLLRNLSSGSTARPSTPDTSREKTSTPTIKEEVPEVKITTPLEKPSTLEPTQKEAARLYEFDEDAPTPEKSKGGEGKKSKPTPDMTLKHLASLGIDPGILQGRGADFNSVLDDYGWIGDGVHTRNVDEMKEDIERDLNRMQATGWLAGMEDDEAQRAELSRLHDVAIDACEELENLLTLYAVELSVSAGSRYLYEANNSIRPSNLILLSSKLKAKVCKYRLPIKSFLRTRSRHFSLPYRSLHHNCSVLGRPLSSPMLASSRLKSR